MLDTNTRPTLDIDPFDEAVMLDPMPTDTAVREAAPIVWLPKYEVWACGRDAEVREIFGDWERFSSAAGTGLTNVKRQKNWRKPSVILETDPPEHTASRRVLSRVLSPVATAKLKETFAKEADALVDRLVEQRQFDAAEDLAFAFPFKMLPDAVGMAQEGREYLMPYSTLNFNAMGPKNERFLAAEKAAEGAFQYVEWQCRRENLEPGKFGAQIYAAADDEHITEEAAGLLVRAFLSAGIDTTVFSIGLAILALIKHPDQWDMFHQNPEMARRVFDEGLRYTPSSPFIGRTTRNATTLSGVELGADEKVLTFLGAANRDPRRWENAEAFDITRNPTGHLSFGTGIHGCVGQVVARAEAEAVLSALARRVKKIELTGDPVPQLINWLRGYSSIPVEVVAA